MPIIDHFLGSDCILGSLSSRIVRPGDPAQRLHGDIPEHMLNLEKPVMMNTVWMLQDTGVYNGGTRIVPVRPTNWHTHTHTHMHIANFY